MEEFLVLVLIMLKKQSNILSYHKKALSLHCIKNLILEDWQSDRMRWTRNPVYPLSGIGGLNPSSSALNIKKRFHERKKIPFTREQSK